MLRFGFSQAELDRAKLNLVSFMERQLSEKDRRDSRSLARGFSSHFLTGDSMADIEWEVDAVNSLLPGIGLREISAAVRDYFAYNDRTVFLIAPEAEEENLPSEFRIRAIFRETERARLRPRQTAEVSGQLLPRNPVPARIVSEAADDETGALIFVLANGTTVILQETANRNNEIVMYAMARGGIANAPPEELISAALVSEMVSVSGLGPYSRIELINMLAGKQVSFSFWASNFYRGFQGSSTTGDIKSLFELIHLFFTMPRLDERAITAMLDQYRTLLQHQQQDPNRVFSRELARIINSDHPLFLPLELEDIDRVSLQHSYNFLNQCININDYTFVFTGNLDLGTMREYLETYISSVPNKAPMNSWVDPQVVRPQNIERNIYRGLDERCIVYLGWFAPGPAGFDEQKNQAAAVLTEYLNIILSDEIREKLGGVYSISSRASVSVIPNGEYSLSVNFRCNPARADELIAAVHAIIREVAEQPLNQDTFNKAKEALLMQHENSMQRNLHIAQSYANSSALFETPLARLDQRPEAIREVTPEAVQALCRDMLVFAPVQVALFPEGWN
jgi:zinc protease